MSSSFYRAFEDRYRGSREMIKARLLAYLPFLAPLRDEGRQCAALDLGCGRGEWLEVLQENGFDARGVDLDDGMLEACHQLGLPAEHGDALTALAALPGDSQAVVSGFHIVEHIPFESVQLLMADALRVLRPGGLLILETPNPENIVVAGSTFYLDPTHERPLPHPLLGFLADFSGFARTKVLRLQEPQHLAQTRDIGLMDVLSGVSPDYAVVAQKGGPAELLARFDSAFAMEYGLALDSLAWKFDNNLDRKIDQVLRETINIQLQRSEERLVRLERERDQALARERAVLDSMSWRITAPLRRGITAMRRLGVLLRGGLRPNLGLRVRLRGGLLALRSRLVEVARRVPWLRARLRRFRYLDHRLRGWLGAGSVRPGAPMQADEALKTPAEQAIRRHKGFAEDAKSPLESWFHRD